MLRAVCRSHTCTPISSLQVVCKCLPVKYVLFKWKLNYCYYLSQLVDGRLVKKAFNCQLLMMQNNNFWYSEILSFTWKIDLPNISLWTKMHVKTTAYNHWLEDVQNQIQTRESMRFMNVLILPSTEKAEMFDNKLDWWWRSKMGGLLLGEKMFQQDICPCCKMAVKENAEHFMLECPALTHASIFNVVWVPRWVCMNEPRDLLIQVQGMLSMERSIFQQKQIEALIRS